MKAWRRFTVIVFGFALSFSAFFSGQVGSGTQIQKMATGFLHTEVIRPNKKDALPHFVQYVPFGNRCYTQVGWCWVNPAPIRSPCVCYFGGRPFRGWVGR